VTLLMDLNHLYNLCVYGQLRTSTEKVGRIFGLGRGTA
jgi:hypothetical protein